MTGCLQRHARKYSIPIDNLRIDFELTSTILVQEEIAAVHLNSLKEDYRAYKGLKNPDDGVYIHGLFLDAGRIDLDTRCLVDPIPGIYLSNLIVKYNVLTNNKFSLNFRRVVSPTTCYTSSANHYFGRK